MMLVVIAFFRFSAQRTTLTILSIIVAIFWPLRLTSFFLSTRMFINLMSFFLMYNYRSEVSV